MTSWLDTSRFMPHASCYMWVRPLITLHAVSDSLIATAYYSIPIVLSYVAHKRRDLPYRWMFFMFGAFIVTCGTTHLMEVVTLYHPYYWISGAIKALTAFLSVLTAILLVALVPRALTLPGPEELKRMNDGLKMEIAQRLRMETRFRSLLEAAPDALVIVNDEGAIVLLNSQAEKLFGFTRDELLGQPVECLLPESARSRHRADRAGYARAPRRRPMGEGLDLMAKHKDGTQIPVEISLSPMTTDEGTLITAAIRDVSERRHREEELRRLNVDLKHRESLLESANKELESFSYSVSHDLRAPLRHIAAFSTFLDEELSTSLNDTGRRYLKKIIDATTQMGALIDDLLSFSRMGRVEMMHARVSLDDVVADAISTLRPDVGSRPIEWKVGALPVVYGDASMLKQAYVNLLSNAAKYTRTKSNPVVEIGSQSPSDSEVICFVRDNGVGFDMRFVGRLFGVFQRLHAASEFEGTGIGLANVRRIIQRHGGRTWAEGKPDIGAVFYFSLPLSRVERTGKDPA